MRESVVFDCDGLLLDTEKFWQEGERRLFAEYGQEYTAEHQQRLIGTSGVETGGILAEVLVQQGRGLALLSELRELVWEAIVNGAQPMPGALDLVRELSAKIPLGVASNSPRELVREALGSAGLNGAFDLILGEEDVRYPKPDAQIYLAACERLNSAPQCSVALEDSPPGVAAARSAGMYVVGVPSIKGAELAANETVDSLEHKAVREAIYGPG